MFWQALEELHRWERENLPGADSAVANEVLAWLVRSRHRPRALKDLYWSSRFSEPTLRNCLKQLCDRGFVVIEFNDDDMRTRFVRGTPKLEETLKQYHRRFQELARIAIDDGLIEPVEFPAAPVVNRRKSATTLDEELSAAPSFSN